MRRSWGPLFFWNTRYTLVLAEAPRIATRILFLAILTSFYALWNITVMLVLSRAQKLLFNSLNGAFWSIWGIYGTSFLQNHYWCSFPCPLSGNRWSKLMVALCVDYNYDPTANRDRIPVVTTAVLVYLFFIDSWHVWCALNLPFFSLAVIAAAILSSDVTCINIFRVRNL